MIFVGLTSFSSITSLLTTRRRRSATSPNKEATISPRARGDWRGRRGSSAITSTASKKASTLVRNDAEGLERRSVLTRGDTLLYDCSYRIEGGPRAALLLLNEEFGIDVPSWSRLLGEIGRPLIPADQRIEGLGTGHRSQRLRPLVGSDEIIDSDESTASTRSWRMPSSISKGSQPAREKLENFRDHFVWTIGHAPVAGRCRVDELPEANRSPVRQLMRMIPSA